MRVLLAATGADISSGAARCLIELAECLKKHDISVIVSIPKRGNIEDELKIRHISYKYIHEYHSWYTSEKHKKNNFLLKNFLNYKCFFEFRKLIKEEKIDIVHENALTGYVAAWAAVSLNVPVIWHIREFMEEDLNIKFYNKKKSLKLINKASHIISISKAIYNKWNYFFSSEMSVVYDGLPIEQYYKKRDWTSITNQINVIIYGRVVEPKGQFFFFKAMNEILKKKKYNIMCYWAGFIEDEIYYEEINDFIDKNKINDRVIYLGQVSDMSKVLDNMDIVAVCSKKEGFGRVTVESMLSGCAVIGANSGATSELVVDNETGRLYDNGNINDFIQKIETMLSNSEYRQHLAKKGQEWAQENFSLEKNTDNIIEIYNRYVK